MTSNDYHTILMDAFNRLGNLARQRDELEAEISKLRQFIRATMNMLPDDQRQQFDSYIDQLNAQESAPGSLTDAVRTILQSDHIWMTSAMVRDRLLARGFDFSRYTSNPLASVSTTLKRLDKKEVESTSIEGVRAYRWKTRKR